MAWTHTQLILRDADLDYLYLWAYCHLSTSEFKTEMLRTKFMQKKNNTSTYISSLDDELPQL